MKITKYEHACLVLEKQGKYTIIDPGIFTTTLPQLSGVEAVVVTHVHPDHIDPEKIQAIVTANPGVQLYSVRAVSTEHAGFAWHVVNGGEKVQTENFQIAFHGGRHATIHESYPATDNVGVFINDVLYYPGDSYALPDKYVTVLAVPAAAPWMKAAESMDFINELRPAKVFPTHNAILSASGNGIYNRLLETTATNGGSQFVFLDPGMTLEA